MKPKSKIIWKIVPLFLITPIIFISFFNKKSDFHLDKTNLRSPQPGSTTQRDSLGLAQGFIQPENIGTIVTPTLSRPVSELSNVAADILPELVREINPRISHHLPQKQIESRNQADFLAPAQTIQQVLPIVVEEPAAAFGPSEFGTPILNFEGSSFTQVHPADTVGAIGKNHYIQMVNGVSGAEFAIYDRTGNLIKGPVALETLGSGNCAAGAGDPIVLYDQLADRWFMSEFHSQTNANVVCHYISQTAEPTGSWFAYEFEMPNFPDYPKYGLWPTAYLGTANEVQNGNTGTVPAIYAFDRLKMLQGAPAGYLRFVLPPLSGFGFQTLAPVDMDGMTIPPVNSNPIFLRHRDDEAHAGTSNGAADFIEVWTMVLDFSNPSAATFMQIADIPIGEFDSTMCGLNSFDCVPQKGSTRRLDPVREALMNRVQYLNHGTHQSIVGNMVTDTTGNNQHGVFWFELRKTGSNWSLYQDGIFAPDSEHRWLGSIAMDVNQNIGLMYNVSGNNTFPSLRYTGRTVNMAKGTLFAQEGSIAEGSAANSSTRYGDYNTLTLDPFDGCTFWATGQYNPTASWSTRIATFKFPECSDRAKFQLTQSATTPEFIQGEAVQIPIVITADSDFTATVQIEAQLLGSGSSLPVAPTSVKPTTIPITLTASAPPLGIGSHTVVFTATAPAQISTALVNFNIIPTIVPIVQLVNPKQNAEYVPLKPNFVWKQNLEGATYDLEISNSLDFATILQSFSAIQATELSLTQSLLNDTFYYWRVRSVSSKAVAPWGVGAFRTEPVVGQCQAGDDPIMVLQNGFENGLEGWEIAGINSSWQIANNRFSAGVASIKAAAPATSSTQRLTSPPIKLAPLADKRWLSFDIWRDTEASANNCYDGMVLEVEKDGVWEMLTPAAAVTDPYDFLIPVSNNPELPQNVLEGNLAWCGTQDWTNSLIDLADYAGNVRIRYHLATDQSVGSEGVYLDNLRIYECGPRDYTYYFPIFFNSKNDP